MLIVCHPRQDVMKSDHRVAGNGHELGRMVIMLRKRAKLRCNNEACFNTGIISNQCDRIGRNLSIVCINRPSRLDTNHIF